MNSYIKIVKICLRNKMAIVWMFLFPIILSTLFYFAFGSLDEEGQLEQISVAWAETSDGEADVLLSVLEELSGSGEDALLKLEKVSNAQDADDLLRDGAVDGYISMENGSPLLTVQESGTSQTILRSILTRYLQIRSLLDAGADPSSIQTLFTGNSGTTISVDNVSGDRSVSGTVIYFYSLLAMVCLYAGFLGNVAVELRQANLSAVGARRCVAPQRPLLSLLVDLLAYLTVSFMSVGLSVLYMAVVLDVDIGGKWPMVLLTCFCGTLVGLLFGAAISITNRLSEGVKTGIVIIVTMICSFLAGLMLEGISYQIQTHCPILALINPASRIADAFYCLYYYDNYGRFFQNIGILAVMAAVLLVIILIFERRQQYESI